MSEFSKILNYLMGGGRAYLGIVPKFFRFLIMMAPLNNYYNCPLVTAVKYFHCLVTAQHQREESIALE